VTRRLSGWGLLVCAALLAACAGRTEPYRTAERPTEPTYASAVPSGGTAYSNESLADLFVQLTHGLENGTSRPALQRFERPVRIGLTGDGAQDYRAFTDTFVGQIARESNIDIATGPGPHNLIVRFVPGEEFTPNTNSQCIVVSGQPEWAEFLRAPDRYGFGLDVPLPINDPKVIHAQTKLSIFIPDTALPHQIRECLIEEITQALGPGNDLFGLGSTIFNDDNAHTWPTAIDFLMLRVLYDPRLVSGLDRTNTHELALAVLDEVNPVGRDAAPLPPIFQQKFLPWRNGVHDLVALNDTDLALSKARELARRAHQLAPESAYDCTSASQVAILASTAESSDLEEMLDLALARCQSAFGEGDIRIQSLRLLRAVNYNEGGRHRQAKDEIEAILPSLIAHGRDDEIATAKIIRLSAAYNLGDPNWDGDLLKEAEVWSAYAYGDDHQWTQRLRP
jgi:hypothetical protein